MISDERIAEIEVRMEAATPGPWRWNGSADDAAERIYWELPRRDRDEAK